MEIGTVSDTVAEHLRLQIITGRLASGERLNEVHLSSVLGISRPPLREALRVLENEHLVVSTPRKGTVVRNISIEDLREVYQAREMIEYYAIDLLKAKNINDLHKIESALIGASDLSVPSTHDPEKLLHYQKVLADYHINLIEATGNFRLFHFYRAISLHLRRYQFMYLSIPGSGQRSLEEHQEILHLIKKNVHGKAKKVMKEHINYAFKSLEKRILNEQVIEGENSEMKAGACLGLLKIR